MNRTTPLVVLCSLVGSLGIYCTSTVVTIRHGGPIGDASADPTGSGNPTGSTCCDNAPGFTKIAEGTLQVTGGYSDNRGTSYGPDIDVSGYRQVSVLESFNKGGCWSFGGRTQFRADASSDLWGDGLPPGSTPIPVLAPVMHVGLEASTGAPSDPNCTTTARYIVLGLK